MAMHSDSGMAFRARLSARDCVPCRSGSIACPSRAQNSIWLAMERSNNYSLETKSSPRSQPLTPCISQWLPGTAWTICLHGIDPFLLTYPDIDSSETEERYVNIGVSTKGLILVLMHTERQGKIRIISCRKATARERRDHEEG